MKLVRTFVIVWSAGLASAFAEPAVDIKVEGDVRAGIEYEKRKNGAHSYAESTLEFASKRREGFRAVIELQGKTETREVRLRDSTIDYKIDEQLQVEFGFGKKRLGTEYNRSSWNQDLLDETLLYEKLEELTLVGRETQIRLFSEKEEKGAPAPNFEVALGLPTSNHNNIRVQKSVDPGEGLPYVNAGLLVQLNKQVYDREQWNGALMLSTWGQSGSHGFETEWVSGLDPYKTEITRLEADGRQVYFSGLKTIYRYDLGSSTRAGWQLIMGASLLQNDLHRPLDRSAQFVSGLNYYLKKTRIALNMDLTGTQNPLLASDWSYEPSRVQIELRQEI